MKLKNKRFRYEDYRQSIDWFQLKRCLFRFLKEFGYYGKYVKDIKPYLVEYSFDYTCNLRIETPISLKKYFRDLCLYAQSRCLFPRETFWNEVYELWVEWSFEEDKIFSKTYIL